MTEEDVMEIYPPTWFVEYDLLKREEMPFCGPHESYSHLHSLYQKDQMFFHELVGNAALRDCFLQRMGNNNNSDVDVPNKEKIEAALVNRATFASLQLSRILACELYLFDDGEKKRVAHDSYQELFQSMNLLEEWGAETAMELHDDLLEMYEQARDLMKRVGLDTTE